MASNQHSDHTLRPYRFQFRKMIPLEEAGVTEENLEKSTFGMKPSSNFLCVPKKVSASPAVVESISLPLDLSAKSRSNWETGATSADKLDIINLKNQFYFQLPICADSAIVDPNEKILAVRVGRTVTFYDVKCVLAATFQKKLSVLKEFVKQNYTEKKIERGFTWMPPTTSCGFPHSELDCVFWKWISVGKIAFVTRDAVYHWNFYGVAGSPPLKIFDRDDSMKHYEIFDYIMDHKEEMYLLIGRRHRHEGGGPDFGRLQLHCASDHNLSRLISDVQAATFVKYSVKSNLNPSTVLCYGYKKEGEEKGKLVIEEVGPIPDGNLNFDNNVADIYFLQDENLRGDFPIGIEISRNGIVHVVTKFGDTHLYDLLTGSCFSNYFYNKKFHPTVNPPINMLFTVANKKRNWYLFTGCIGVSREGVVFSFSVNEEEVIECIQIDWLDPVFALELATRKNWRGAEYLMKFNSLLKGKRFTEAIELAIKSPRGILRTAYTIWDLKQVEVQRDQLHPVNAYFTYLQENGIELNEVEKEEYQKLVRPEYEKHIQEYPTPSRSHKRKHSPDAPLGDVPI